MKQEKVILELTLFNIDALFGYFICKICFYVLLLIKNEPRNNNSKTISLDIKNLENMYEISLASLIQKQN